MSNLLGGLSRGCGFDETTSLVWLLSMPVCGEVHKSMQEIAGLVCPGEVPKDLSKSRIICDSKDLQCILDYFQERAPFQTNNKEVKSLSSGIVAENLVNVEKAWEVGNRIIASM